MNPPMVETKLLKRSSAVGPRLDALSTSMKLLSYAILIVGAVVMFLPFVWMVSSACKPQSEINTVPVQWLPQNVSCLQNLADFYNRPEDFN